MVKDGDAVLVTAIAILFTVLVLFVG